MIVTYDALCVRDNSVNKKCSGQRDTRISRYVYTFIRIYVYISIYTYLGIRADFIFTK